MGAWRWDSVEIFLLSFYFTSKLLPLPPKKFITWFQFTTILTGALVHWQSFVKQNLSNDFSSLTLAIAHCTQLPLPVAVHRCQKYLFMEMVKWCYDFVVVFCQKMLSHDLPITVACRHCQSPLPFAFASQCCQSMLPVAIHCCCSFLWVLVFYIRWSKHFYRSMGREMWGRKHWTDNNAFFLFVFCQKNIYWEWTLLSKEFLFRWDSEAFFSGCILSEIFRWRWNSVEFFSCCLLSTWGWEH